MSDVIARRSAADGASKAPSAQTIPEPAPTAASPPGGRGRKPLSPLTRLFLLGAGLTVLVIAGVYGLQWWTHGRFVEATNDAYLRADAVTVAPKVGGYVQQVYVRENQAVTPGQPLVRIDSANYDAALAQQEASLLGRRADAASARMQIEQQQAAVAETRAQLVAAKVDAAYAEGDARRYDTLSAQGVEPTRTRDNARHTRDQALVAVKAREAAVIVAERQVATLRAQTAQTAAAIDAQAAQVRAATLNQGDTLLRASAAGRVGDRSVRVGQFVQPGQRLMSVVPTEEIYLVANFKETQVGRIKVGQAATVRIDALGGERIGAVVDSFAPGTGAQFALLPPENATGNFTKIVQRVPVRFRLRASGSAKDHLLPGLSATVRVDTTQPPERGS